MNLETALAHVEQQVQAVSTALLATDAPEMERCTAALRQAAAGLADAMARTDATTLPPALAQRLKAVGNSIGMQRDNLARVAALTERQVATVVPQAGGNDSPTYSSGPGTGNKSSVARLYKSAG